MVQQKPPGAVATGFAPAGTKSAASQILLSLIQVWAWVFLAVLILFFVVSVPLVSGSAVSFLTVRNSQNILVAITPVLLLGLGQTFVIISGGSTSRLAGS